MNFIKLLTSITTITMLVGCSYIQPIKTGHALPGTETVVVGISVDKNGIPKESYKDVVVYPGQNVVYAGPSEFSIVFKNRKTPNNNIENRSINGVVTIKIPEDILEKKEFSEEFRLKKSLTFDYSISVNGKELDPPMIVIPRIDL